MQNYFQRPMINYAGGGLTFASSELEQEWEHATSLRRRSGDINSGIVALTMMEIVFFILRSIFALYPVWAIIAIHALCVPVGLVALIPILTGYGLKIWNNLRSPLVTSAIMLRAIVYCATLGGSYVLHEETLQRSGSLTNTILLPLQFFVNMLLFSVTLKWARLRAAGLFACMTVMTTWRCKASLDGGYISGSYYQNNVAQISSFFQAYLPFPWTMEAVSRNASSVTSGGGNGSNTYETQLDDLGACLLTHLSAHFALGVLIPLALFFAEEEHSRKQFERQTCYGTGFGYSSTVNSILQLLLVPFQALVAFYAIHFVLQFELIRPVLHKVDVLKIFIRYTC